jgi:uncharacterized iron-regulated protein
MRPHSPPRRAAPLALLAALAACASRDGPPPGGMLHRDHPLAGRAFDVRDQRFVDLPAIEAALPTADFVLLGETHDNPDHHLLQARLLRSLVAAGRRPAVAFEMLDVQQQPAVDAALARAPRDPDALAEAVGWAKGGWPAFSLYRPVFAAALDAGLPIVAVNLPRKQAREVVSSGAAALSPEVRALLDREGPLPEDVARQLRAEMYESHCKELPESMLDPMVLMQRARDAEMATRLAAAAKPAGVLVAGTGHVRNDRGVPAHLALAAPGRRALSVAFLEVEPDKRAPQAYSLDDRPGTLPFDYVVFTPAAAREDPCESLRKRKKPAPAG